jgi:hypothetical protein
LSTAKSHQHYMTLIITVYLTTGKPIACQSAIFCIEWNFRSHFYLLFIYLIQLYHNSGTLPVIKIIFYI